MQTRIGDFWEIAHDYEALVCPTNGVVKTSGLVMGAGIALAFAQRYPYLPREWGEWVSKKGNIVGGVRDPVSGKILLSFPTKHDFRNAAKKWLIAESVARLVKIVDVKKIQSVLLPMVGCGLGGLKFSDVAPILEKLDNRYCMVIRPGDLPR